MNNMIFFGLLCSLAITVLPNTLSANSILNKNVELADSNEVISAPVSYDRIVAAAPCPDLCSRTDGPMDFVFVSVDEVNAANLFTVVNLTNVSELRLKIYMITGSLIFDQTAYCLNGIDRNIFWDGRNEGGSHVANTDYTYEITISNDCDSYTFNGSLEKSANYTGPNSTNLEEECTNGFNRTPEPCCVDEPNLYINNQVLIGPGPGWSEYILRKNIFAATALPDFSDQVRINHDARVLFRAGDQITLAEGFHTTKGAVFIAEIKSCGPGFTGGTQGMVQSMATNEQISSNNWLKIFPNPASNFVQLEFTDLKENQSADIRIIDVSGKNILQTSTRENNYLLDTQNFAEGIYFISLRIGLEFLETRRVIIRH